MKILKLSIPNQSIFVLLLLAIGQFSAQAQTHGENLFDDTFLHEIRFTDVDTNLFISTKDYQMLNMTFDGTAVSDVGFKRKGNISGYPETNKYGMKIKTNKYVIGQEFDEIKEFTLHMNYQDPTMLREKLTYEICDEMGLFSLRTAFAKVYLNDVYWGVFTIVEGKDEMYKHVWDNRDADAMESTDFGGMCYQGPGMDDYYQEFLGFYYEADNGDPATAWPRFIEMLDKVNNTPDADYMSVAPDYLNIEDFLIYQAINVYLLNFDSYIGFVGNQRYVYDEANSIWQVTPWDFNASFGLWNTNNFTITDYSMIQDFTCFGNKYQTIPALKEIYLNAMCRLSNNVIGPAKMNARIDVLKAQIQDAVYDDYRKVATNADFDAGTEFGYNELFFENQPALKTLVQVRHDLVIEGLATEGFECQTNTDNIYQNANQLAIAPNPASDMINLDIAIAKRSKVLIMNSIGQVVRQENLTQNELNVAALAKGSYFVVVQDGEQVWNGKFVKL